MKIRTLFTLLLLLIGFPAMCQEANLVDSFYASGKVYVVVAVLATVLIGIVIYLVMMERKLKRIEKELKDK